MCARECLYVSIRIYIYIHMYVYIYTYVHSLTHMLLKWFVFHWWQPPNICKYKYLFSLNVAAQKIRTHWLADCLSSDCLTDCLILSLRVDELHRHFHLDTVPRTLPIDIYRCIYTHTYTIHMHMHVYMCRHAGHISTLVPPILCMYICTHVHIYDCRYVI